MAAYEALEKFDLPAMDRELAQVGINYRDWHAGNLMKRNGKFVVNDIGYSDNEGQVRAFLPADYKAPLAPPPEPGRSARRRSTRCSAASRA